MQTREALRPQKSSDLTPDGQPQRRAKRLLMDEKQLETLQKDLRVLNRYVQGRHLEMLAPGGEDHCSKVLPCQESSQDQERIAIYQITKLLYNTQENTFEKLVSLYSSLNSFGGIAAMILRSDGHAIQLYLAAHTNGSAQAAGDLLLGNLCGQFPGCEVTALNQDACGRLLDDCTAVTAPGLTVRSLAMIPSRREAETNHDRQFSAQGMEKFVDAMHGRAYTLIILNQSVPSEAMDQSLEGLEAIYSALSPYAKEGVTYSESENDQISFSLSHNFSQTLTQSISCSYGTSHTSSISSGRSTSDGSGLSMGKAHFSSGSASNYGQSTSHGSQINEGTTQADGKTSGFGEGESYGSSNGSTRGLNLSRENKSVQELLRLIDSQIQRIRGSQTFGMWNSACYLIADQADTATIGSSTLASLLCGDNQTPRVCCNQWDAAHPQVRRDLLNYLRQLRHPVIRLTMQHRLSDGRMVPGQEQEITPAMMISGKEIATLMSLPTRSVPGVTVDSMAQFGRNIPQLWKAQLKRPVELGTICHMGKEEPTSLVFDLDAFASHTFICGSAGSGKDNTMLQLLVPLFNSGVHALVLSVAKGEYLLELNGMPGMQIFTAHPTAYRQLRINPFAFPSQIHIRTHLSHLTEVVCSCWPLYGAMKGILKAAFEMVYQEHGWDLDHSCRLTDQGPEFPVFRDLERALKKIIESSGYSHQTESDYKGALLNRVSELSNGFEGLVFGHSTGVSDEVLFDANTIIDLSAIGSEESRGLIMGLLLLKLRHHRRIGFRKANAPLHHVTVLDEAHTLLKNCVPQGGEDASSIQAKAVESLCNAISERRSYGEGFFIVDQSPTAVNRVAIQNTATKIVMNMPDKNDCEAIGHALNLTDDQIRELSRLPRGRAAVFHREWAGQTVLAKMGNAWDHRWSVAEPVMDPKVCTQVTGCVLQLMYGNIIQGDGKHLQKNAANLLASLGERGQSMGMPQTKIMDLEDAIAAFVKDNRTLVEENRIPQLKREFYGFAFDLLKLDGMMKVFPLEGVEPRFGEGQLTAKEIRQVLKWERKVRQSFLAYLQVPLRWDPEKDYVWSEDPQKGQFFPDLYQGLLFHYAQGFRDYRYANALAYLQSTDHFRHLEGV